jgi:hypothetical protein
MNYNYIYRADTLLNGRQVRCFELVPISTGVGCFKGFESASPPPHKQIELGAVVLYCFSSNMSLGQKSYHLFNFVAVSHPGGQPPYHI